ncbi:hypothetical protein PPHE_b0830 [Pseudoalteromonas phenolica O-BC30]|nr:hypothetical protein [Pseudoalteromonas phenolica O-BC30]
MLIQNLTYWLHSTECFVEQTLERKATYQKPNGLLVLTITLEQTNEKVSAS